MAHPTVNPLLNNDFHEWVSLPCDGLILQSVVKWEIARGTTPMASSVDYVKRRNT